MYNIEFIFGQTKDGLNLQGTHWNSLNKETCIVCVHGMGGNIIENYFPHIFGRVFTEKNIGFIYGHNRGYSHINDIETINGEHKRIGTTYEIFEECIFDIDLWVNEALKLGYKNVILLGHSFGCNKCIYYLSKSKNVNVIGLVLASPPDMQGLTKLEQPNYDELMEEAQKNVDNKEPRKILSSLLGDWNYISSEAYINWFKTNSNCDNVPILRNPDKFEQLSVIDIPIFALSGENEEALYKKLDVLKEKAISCPNFEWTIVNNSGHTYKRVEENVAKLILEWKEKIK